MPLRFRHTLSLSLNSKNGATFFASRPSVGPVHPERDVFIEQLPLCSDRIDPGRVSPEDGMIRFRSQITRNCALGVLLLVLLHIQASGAIPPFSPPGGVYKKDVSLQLSAESPGTTIRYTLDGDEPTAR